MPESSSSPPSSASPREIEWQLEVADLEPVRRWIAAHPSFAELTLQALPTQQLQDTYLDTPDFRIFRAGYALRMRVSGEEAEATLKSVTSASEEMADRVELNEPMAAGTLASLGRLNGPVGSRVRAVLGRHALQPLFEVRTRRERFAVQDSLPMAEIALDDTLLVQGRQSVPSLRVEIESKGPVRDPLPKLVKTLTQDCELHRAAMGKFELGLRSFGLDPRPPAQPPPKLIPIMGAGEAIRISLRQQLEGWAQHEPGTRLGDDPAELHQLRLSARRMEALIRLYEGYLPRPLGGLRPRLKEVLRALGEVRDLDLQLKSLAQFQLGLTSAERRSLEPFVQHLEAGRARARRQMLAALDAPATDSCIARLTKVLSTRRKSPPPKKRDTLVTVAPEVIARRFRKLRKAFRGLGEESSMEAYHLARRRAKKVRYALEPVEELYGKPARRMLRSLRRLLDCLGDQQDAHVARTRLSALVDTPPEGFGTMTWFLMGRLAEHQAVPGEVRRRIRKAWRKLAGPRWKSLRAQMREVRQSALADFKEERKELKDAESER